MSDYEILKTIEIVGISLFFIFSTPVFNRTTKRMKEAGYKTRPILKRLRYIALASYIIIIVLILFEILDLFGLAIAFCSLDTMLDNYYDKKEIGMPLLRFIETQFDGIMGIITGIIIIIFEILEGPIAMR